MRKSSLEIRHLLRKIFDDLTEVTLKDISYYGSYHPYTLQQCAQIIALYHIKITRIKHYHLSLKINAKFKGYMRSDDLHTHQVWFWRKIYQRCNPDLFCCYLQLVKTAWPIKNSIWKLYHIHNFQSENKPDHLPIFFLLDTILWVVQWTLDRPDLQSFGQGLFVCFAKKETTAKLSVAPSLLYTLGMLDL